MKRIFSFVLFVSMCSSFVLADAYHDALVTYIKGSKENLEQVEQSLGDAMQAVFPNNAEKAAQIITEYFSTQGNEDIADIYEPAFRKYVSLEDLQELAKIYKDPRYMEMSQRSVKVMAELTQSPEYTQFTNQLTTAIQTIAAGGNPQPLPVSASVSEEYQQLFHTYYVESQIGEALNEAYKPVIGMMETALTNKGVKNAKSIATSIVAYVSANTETLFLNIYSKAFTQDDLNLLIEASASPAQKHAMSATKEIVSDPVALMTSLLTKMSAWMQANHPEYAGPFNRVLEELKNNGI